jgi:hypothetical protein
VFDPSQLEKNLPLRVRTSPRFLGSRRAERKNEKTGDIEFTKPPISIVTDEKFNGWEQDEAILAPLLVPFDVALAAAAGYDFLGYNLTNSYHVVSDLDDCFHPDGALKPWAAEYVELVRPFTFYAELSPSDTGLHLWHARDRNEKINFDGKKKIERNFPDGKVEFFWNNYVTVTGKTWGEFDE